MAYGFSAKHAGPSLPLPIGPDPTLKKIVVSPIFLLEKTRRGDYINGYGQRRYTAAPVGKAPAIAPLDDVNGPGRRETKKSYPFNL